MAIEDFRRRIQEAREAKGWEIRDLARHVGISRSHVHRIEAGSRYGTLPVLIRIAQTLDLDLNVLKDEVEAA